MLVIPAIDLKDGQCVRLKQGRMEDETVFSDDPVAVADRWVQAGAKRLHLVDLNGAFAGQPMNDEAIHAIAQAYPDLELQVGGGIRDEATVQRYLNIGVNYVIIGTKAVTNPHFVSEVCLGFPGHIIVGLDARDDKVATEGWSKLSHHNVFDIAQRFADDGVSAIVFTDIKRDGMLQGVNIDSTVALARAVNVPVIASGGITGLDDIRTLCAVEDEGVMGAITGRAIYEGTLDFVAAQQLVEEYQQGKINK